MTSPDQLIERDDVLGLLLSKLKEAAAGFGRVVFVSGEVGVGKSAVVAAFLAALPNGTAVFSGACDPLATPVPLGPVLELRDALMSDAAARLTEALDSPADVAAAIIGVLDHSSPSVWAIDDIQWADAATITVLRHLVDHIVDIPLLLVLIHRIEDLGSALPFTELLTGTADLELPSKVELAPLTRAGVMALAGARPDIDIDRLVEVTGGNPFLVSESLAADGDDTVPRNVSDHVAGRLSRLSTGARAVIDAVAVLGSDATIGVLAQIVPEAETELPAAVLAGVLEQHGRAVAFRHELIRHAVLDAIPVFERRALHTSALTVLSSDNCETSLACLVFHAEEAGDGDAVLRHASRAAQDAMHAGAFDEAVDQYARAVRHSRGHSPAVRALLLENQARAAYLSGHVLAAADIVTDAIALRREIGDLLREGDDQRWLSHYRFLAGALPALVDSPAEAAVRILEPLGPTPELAGAYANMAQRCFSSADHVRAEDYADKAGILAEHLDAFADATWARLFAALSAVPAVGGWSAFDDTWSMACADPRTVEAAAVGGVIACWLATAHCDLDRAERYLTETADLCTRHHLRGFETFTAGISTTLLLHRGRYGEASAVAQEILARNDLPPMFRLPALVSLALARARTGDHDVWPLLDEALRGQDSPAPWLTGTVLAARVEVAWLAGDQDGAYAEARQALAALPTDGDEWARGQITAWAAIVGVIGAPPLDRDHSPYALQVKLQWDSAAAEWRRQGCPYEAAIAAAHSSNPGTAADAVGELQSLGAQAAAERACSLRRRRHKRRATQSNPFGLTNREQQIADLLAERNTDKQIAEILVISQRTASNHVASVLAKLGVHSRRAVRDLLRPNREAELPTSTPGTGWH